MKDSLLNLLVFLLVFLAVALFFLATYGVSLLLVPGGQGLIFSNPWAAALLPGLLGGLVVAIFRSAHHPGRFAMTWLFLAAAFFLLLTLSIPLIEKTPPVRASDDSPLVPGRFLPLEDGALLLTSGSAAVLIPPDDSGMLLVAEAQYDSLNQRFVFSSGEPRAHGSTGPERRYFQFPPAMASLQNDLLAIYRVLRDSAAQDLLRFLFQSWAVTWLFLGLFFFFSWKTWPLVHLILVLVLVRLGLILLVYAFWSIPALVDLWTPEGWRPLLRTMAPIVLIDVAAACLFFMTWLTKPYRRTALR